VLTDGQHAVQHVPDLHLDGGFEGPGEKADASKNRRIQGAGTLLGWNVLLG